MNVNSAEIIVRVIDMPVNGYQFLDTIRDPKVLKKTRVLAKLLGI